MVHLNHVLNEALHVLLLLLELELGAGLRLEDLLGLELELVDPLEDVDLFGLEVELLDRNGLQVLLDFLDALTPDFELVGKAALLFRPLLQLHGQIMVSLGRLFKFGLQI